MKDEKKWSKTYKAVDQVVSWLETNRYFHTLFSNTEQIFFFFYNIIIRYISIFKEIDPIVQNHSETLERGQQRVKIQNIFRESMARDSSRNLYLWYSLFQKSVPIIVDPPLTTAVHIIMPKYQLGRVQKSQKWSVV